MGKSSQVDKSGENNSPSTTGLGSGPTNSSSEQLLVAVTALADWAIASLTALVHEAMSRGKAIRDTDRTAVLNQLRRMARHALYQHENPRQCLLSFLAVVSLRPVVNDWTEVDVPSASLPLFHGVTEGQIEKAFLWKTLGENIKPEESPWETFDDFLCDEPESPTIGGRYPLWFVSTDRVPYDGTQFSRILPLLWSIARENGWATSDNGTHFQVPTTVIWHADLDRWTSPEHHGLFAALSWSWEQSRMGKSRHRAPEGPHFILSLGAVPRGHDDVWQETHVLLGGHDRKHRMPYIQWRGERAITRSPLHVVALVSEILDSEKIEVRMISLPNGAQIRFGTPLPRWPSTEICHHDLEILGREECEDCLGIGYTIDNSSRVDQRVVRPCPECCERILKNYYDDDSEDDPWPRANDDALARYNALREHRETMRRRKKGKGASGRKRNKIKLRLKFVISDSAETARRWANIQEVLNQVKERQRIAEETALILTESPRPKMTVDVGALVKDFVQFATLGGVSLSDGDIDVETLSVPHIRPKRLPQGKQAIYVFCTDWDCLKVGKAGPKTESRFTSQHYSPRANNSTLSRSLLNCDAIKRATLLAGVLPEPTEDDIGTWIEQHTTRYNFLISADQPPMVLTLLETFLQTRLRPLFEQRQSE